MTLQISPILAAFMALLGAVLTIRVIMSRVKLDITAGDGGNAVMRQAIRAHGNFAEQVPLALILFALAEMNGAPRMALYGLAGLLVIGRLASAMGLSGSTGISTGRQAGAGMTIIYMVGTALLIGYTVYIKP